MYVFRMCVSRKYLNLPQGWPFEIPKGRGILKAKFFKGKYEVKLEFPEGWWGGRGGSNQTTIHRGSMDIFYNNNVM